MIKKQKWKKKEPVFFLFLTVIFPNKGPPSHYALPVSSMATVHSAALGENSFFLLSVVFQNEGEACYREVTFCISGKLVNFVMEQQQEDNMKLSNPPWNQSLT